MNHIPIIEQSRNDQVGPHAKRYKRSDRFAVIMSRLFRRAKAWCPGEIPVFHVADTMPAVHRTCCGIPSQRTRNDHWLGVVGHWD